MSWAQIEKKKSCVSVLGGGMHLVFFETNGMHLVWVPYFRNSSDVAYSNLLMYSWWR
jgi:hypothetical protein